LRNQTLPVLDDKWYEVNDAIKRVLSSPRDLSVEEIAELTGIHRNTVSKYVYGLEEERKIALTRQVGGAKTTRDSKFCKECGVKAQQRE